MAEDRYETFYGIDREASERIRRYHATGQIQPNLENTLNPIFSIAKLEKIASILLPHLEIDNGIKPQDSAYGEMCKKVLNDAEKEDWVVKQNYKDMTPLQAYFCLQTERANLRTKLKEVGRNDISRKYRIQNSQHVRKIKGYR